MAKIGSKVVVYNFGQHIGTVVRDDERYPGWVVVALDDGREWRGNRRLVRRYRPKVAAAMNEYRAA